MNGFKVVTTFAGDADVVDRASGEIVGYLLRGFHPVWESFCIHVRGKELARDRYRQDAAERVWVHAKAHHFDAEGRFIPPEQSGEQTRDAR